MQTINIGKISNLSEHLLIVIDGEISVSVNDAVETLIVFDRINAQ